MEIKRGDKVKFLNEAGGGIVVNVIDNKQALVQIEDGFEFPVLISELIKTESSGEKEFKAATPEKKGNGSTVPPVIKKASSENNVATQTPVKVKEVFKPLFAIVPLDEKLNADSTSFDLYLLNDGDYYFYYIAAIEKHERMKMIEKGELEPEMKVKLATYDFDDLLKMDAIVIDLLAYAEHDYKSCNPIHYRLNLKSTNLLREGNYKENDYFYENAFMFNLAKESEKTENKSIISKEKVEEKPAPGPQKNPDIEEVDLHIEEIVESVANMSAGDILNTQMARFTTTLDGAILGKTKKIVFIHGVGNGKLRYEIQKTLNSKYPDLKYQDASFAEYGYGATMVMVRK